MKAKAISTRHKWAAGVRHFTDDGYHDRTDRACIRCGMVQASIHEPEGAWDAHRKDYWLGRTQIKSELTPLCDARLELKAAAAAVSEPA